MPWWAWVLIGVAVVAGAVVKGKVLGRWMERRKRDRDGQAEE